MSDSEELLNIKQAAALLKVTETSLRRWTDSGRLACLRVGARRERRFRRADLMAFLEDQPATASAATSTSRSTLIGGVPVGYGTHLCSFYSSDAARTKLAVGFLADALSQDSASFLIATPQAGREVVAQLEAERPTRGWGQPSSDHIIVSEYRSTAAAELEMLEELFVAAVRRGCRSLRLVGNVSESSLGQRKGFSNITQYEEGYGRLARRFPIVTLCQYDARRHSGLELCDIMKCHADVFRYPADRLLL
jgi:transcriptional repressor of dcmA and dcmR